MAKLFKLQSAQSPDAQGAFALESEARSYCRRIDATFVSASGSHITSSGGRRYIDFLAAASSLNYGHNDPDMADALIGYVKGNGIAQSLDFHTGAKEKFIETFSRLALAPRSLDYKLQFTGPTGANAVEAALKLARKVTGRSEVIAFTNGYHGMSLGALAVTGNRYNRMGVSVQLPGVTRALYDGYLGPQADTAAILEQALDDPSSGFDQPAAILLETVQGEGGLNAASRCWAQKIAAIAQRHGALLIVDDIQAGCGRAGTFFSFETLGISPDIVVMSKSLSGFGLPLSLALIKPEYDQWKPGEHNGTFRGNNLAFVTAAVALEKFWADDTLQRDIERRGRIVESSLKRLTGLIPGSKTKGRGMMRGVDVGSEALAAAIALRAFHNGLILETCGPRDEVIKIFAPLTTPDDVLAEGLDIIRCAIEEESAMTRAAP